MPEYLYRYDYTLVSLGLDQFDEPYPGHSIRLTITKYRIIKRTPQGAWIDTGYSWAKPQTKKFVLLTAKKQFASETEERAKEAFIARKYFQLGIYKSKIKDIEQALKLAGEKLDDKTFSHFAL